MVLVGVLLCAGCKDSYLWREGREPMTEAEHKAVAEMTERILAATPRSLSGHDQDWDDAIVAAQRAARESVCKLRLFEYLESPGRPTYERTGRWKDLEQAQTEIKTTVRTLADTNR